MTITIPTDAVKARLGHGKLWVKGWGDDPHDPTEPTCLHGAIRACLPQPGDAFLVQAVATAQGWGTADNDGATGWGEIESMIDAHPEVSDKDLAWTFGPQWVEIVALIRRAAVLTGDEAKALRSTPKASWLTTQDADRKARWLTTQDADRHAVRSAAWDAAWDGDVGAGGYVTSEAVLALSVRDLIGDVFTQWHYNTLTGPWRTVIGPIHPDDAPLEESAP